MTETNPAGDNLSTVKQQVKDMGVEIAKEFLQRLNTKVTPDPEEMALIRRVSERLAFVAISIPLADPERAASLKVIRDAALASLENMKVAEAIRAEQVMRETVFDVIARVLKAALGILVAVAA